MKGKIRFRIAMPWYYTPSSGNWILGFWNHMGLKVYREWGFRILGFEFWVEYF